MALYKKHTKPKTQNHIKVKYFCEQLNKINHTMASNLEDFLRRHLGPGQVVQMNVILTEDESNRYSKKVADFRIKKIFKNETVNMNIATECSICLENECQIQTNCFHNFCESCIKIWLREHESCPYCLGKITECKKIKVIGEN